MIKPAQDSLDVSVIIASYNMGHVIGHCLDALLQQSGTVTYEVIIVDSSIDDTAAYVQSHPMPVKLLHFGDRKFPGDARNAGLAHAGGKLIAFTDADCIPAADWLESIVSAYQKYPDELVIGGVVENANPTSYVACAAHLCSFAQWQPRKFAQRMNEVPTCCLSMKPQALRIGGSFAEGVYSSDTEYFWRLASEGIEPLCVPSIRVAHINDTTLRRFASKMRQRGLHFAALRGRSFSVVKRLLYLTMCVLLPVRLVFKRAWQSISAGALTQFVLAAPLIVVGMVCWSIGEAQGYAGSNESDTHD